MDKKKFGEVLNTFGFRNPDDLGILNHCLLVGAVAELMADRLALKGIEINPELVATAGRYHDFGKMNNGPQEKEHVLKAHKYFLDHGDREIAQIILCHEPYSFGGNNARYFGMEPNRWEEKLLLLADLRVSDRIMSWNERIGETIKKYRKNDLFAPGREEWLKKTANQLIGELQKIIGSWDFLEFTPYDLNHSLKE